MRCPWCHSPHSWEVESPLLFNQTRCINCQKCRQVCKNNVHSFKDGKHIVDRKNCTKCGKCIHICPTSRNKDNSGALILPTRQVEPEELFDHIRPQLEILKKSGGVTLSGGEALLQKDDVIQFLKICKEDNIHTAIETSLTLPTEVYSKVNPFVDCWLIGLRDTSFQKEDKTEDKLISKNVSFLSESDKEIIVRYPIIKGYTDSREDLLRIVHFMKTGDLNQIELLPCNENLEHYYNLSGITPLLLSGDIITEENMIESIAKLFKEEGFSTKVLKI